jgi:hypothetical protein
MVADALSRLPNSVDAVPIAPITSMLIIKSDLYLLKSIHNRYLADPICTNLSHNQKSIDGIHWESGLLYIADHLMIPCVGTLQEDLF